MTVLFVPGWGYHSSIFNNNSHPTITIEWNKALTDSLLIEKTIKAQTSVILVGWSIGAYLLQPFMSLPQVVGCIFISSGLSFSTLSNPYGVSPKIINKMKDKLLSKTSAVLNDFYKKVGPTPDAYKNEATKEEQLMGLTLLGDYLSPTQLWNKKTLWVHGIKDLILPFQSSLLAAKMTSSLLYLMPDQGHLLPSSFINKLIQEHF